MGIWLLTKSEKHGTEYRGPFIFFKKSMSQNLRDIDPNGVYHIISRGNNKSTVFLDSADYLKYLTFLRKAKRLYSFSLYHYVLMPNHVHLLIKPNNHDLSRVMHLLQMSYAKYFCKKYQFVGHVWQRRFKNLTIKNDAYLFACGNYIEMNPVRAFFCELPEAWRWSSYEYYAFGAKIDLVDRDPIFETLAKNETERMSSYRTFINKTRSF
jgi:putative transposase